MYWCILIFRCETQDCAANGIFHYLYWCILRCAQHCTTNDILHYLYWCILKCSGKAQQPIANGMFHNLYLCILICRCETQHCATNGICHYVLLFSFLLFCFLYYGDAVSLQCNVSSVQCNVSSEPKTLTYSHAVSFQTTCD